MPAVRHAETIIIATTEPPVVTAAEVQSIVIAEPHQSPTASLNDLALLQRNTLSDDQRYTILTSQTPKLKVYPVNSQKRCFQHKWSQHFPWIRYSDSTDGVFCAPCFLFNAESRLNDEFFRSPFRDWKNATGVSRGALSHHSLSRCHIMCNEQALTFLSVMDKRTPSVKSRRIQQTS